MKVLVLLMLSTLTTLGAATPIADRSSELTLEPRQCTVNGRMYFLKSIAGPKLTRTSLLQLPLRMLLW